ncbi:GIY-YIG nuclease family protein [Clostridioides difficile]|uniref:GIY-YIG nuclease family protein n=1 Tax=Clostridioides difficile TaxID=1496 RepID=UPI000D1F65C9|nr:GIY-YIG nuclease family protein [Clostridioides difficile]
MIVYGMIYKITNKINNKVYIGQTTLSIKERYGARGIQSVVRKSKNKHLKDSIKKYGYDAFELIEEYDVAYSKEELDEKETYYINKYNSTNRLYGYNKKEGGSSGKHVEETKIKQSRIMMGKYINEKNPRATKVVCLNTKEVFDTLKQAGEKYNIEKGNLSSTCKKEYLSAGKHPETKEPLVWRYYEEFKTMYEQDILDALAKAKNYGKGSNNNSARAVVLLNTGEVFNTMKDASEKYNVQSSDISNCCNGKRKSAGKHPITNQKLIWMKVEKHNMLSKDEIESIIKDINKGIKGANNYRAKKVILVNTEEIFESITDGANKYGIKNTTHITSCCTGKRKSCGKHPETGEKLIWMYYDDYKNKLIELKEIP